MQVRYASECKVPNKKGKEKVWRGFASRDWDLTLKPSLPKQSVKFKYQIWFEIIKKFAKKCLDASSL